MRGGKSNCEEDSDTMSAVEYYSYRIKLTLISIRTALTMSPGSTTYPIFGDQWSYVSRRPIGSSLQTLKKRRRSGAKGEPCGCARQWRGCSAMCIEPRRCAFHACFFSTFCSAEPGTTAASTLSSTTRLCTSSPVAANASSAIKSPYLECVNETRSTAHDRDGHEGEKEGEWSVSALVRSMARWRAAARGCSSGASRLSEPRTAHRNPLGASRAR